MFQIANIRRFVFDTRFILSIDIGSVNFAVVCYDVNNKLFVHCALHNISAHMRTNMDTSNAVYGIVRDLISVFPLLSISHVLIEKQVRFIPNSRSKTCVNNSTIERSLFGIFLAFGVTTVSIDPRAADWKVGSHKMNKKIAVRMMDQYISESIYLFSKNVTDMINALRKKDDVADAVVQVVTFIQSNI